MKKYRIKWKNIAILVFIVLILVILIINPIKLKAKKDLAKLNYQDSSIDYIMDKGLKNKTLEHDYSEFVDELCHDKDFKVENYDIYLDLDYYAKSNSVSLINKLISEKYSTDEINLILKSGNNKSIATFVEGTKYEKISDFLKYDYAKLSLLDRYIEYKASNVCTFKDAIVNVNIGIDKDFYDEYTEVEEFSTSMIVNKYHRVSETFVPDDLEDIPKELLQGNNKEQGNKEMIKELQRMATDLNRETGKKIYVSNAYRSYAEQEKLYNDLLKQRGESYVKNSVSRPGFSEHQTGLIFNIDTVGEFKNSIERDWLKNNAYKYGFILRYPDNKSDITGYKGIIKQYRYVGADIANYIAKNNITYEEYFAMFLDRE